MAQTNELFYIPTEYSVNWIESANQYARSVRKMVTSSGK